VAVEVLALWLAMLDQAVTAAQQKVGVCQAICQMPRALQQQQVCEHKQHFGESLKGKQQQEQQQVEAVPVLPAAIGQALQE
jgi:hypothetical protein